MVACPASALPGIDGNPPPRLLFSEPAVSFLPPIFPYPESWRSLPEGSRLFGPQSMLSPEALSDLPPMFYFSALALLGGRGRDLEKLEAFLWSLIELDYSRPGKPPRIELAEELREAGFEFPPGVILEAEKWLHKKCASDWEIALRCALYFLLQFIVGIYSAVPTATGVSEGQSAGQNTQQTQFERREEQKRILVCSLRQAEADELLPKVYKSAQDVKTGRWEKLWVWRSDLIEECHKELSVQLAPDCVPCRKKRQVKIRTHSCYQPDCPHCQHARAMRLQVVVALFFEEMQRRAQARGQSVKYITLTFPNVESLDGGGAYTLALNSLTRLRHRELWVSRVPGGLYVLEVTNEGNGWHLHIHALVDSDWWDEKNGNGKFELSKLWKSCLPESVQALVEEAMPEGSKDRAIVWIKEADASSVRELSKYIAKGSGFYHDPDRVAEFYQAVKGRRCFSIFGPEYQRLYRLYREMEKRVKAGHCLGDFKIFWGHYKRVVEGSELTRAHKDERLKNPQEMVDFFYSARRSLEEVKKNSDSKLCPHGVPLVDAGPLDDPRDLSWQDGVLSLSESAYKRALSRARSP